MIEPRVIAHRRRTPRSWREIIDHLMFEGLLEEDTNDGRPLLALGDPEEVRAVYRKQRRIEVRRQPEAFDPATRSGDCSATY